MKLYKNHKKLRNPMWIDSHLAKDSVVSCYSQIISKDSAALIKLIKYRSIPAEISISDKITIGIFLGILTDIINP